MYREVLRFWFEETAPKQWWLADAAFDALLANRFREVHARAAQAELFDWRKDPPGRLAEIIVLDQFSRNIYRNTALAFAQDPLALVLAQEAIAAGADRQLAPLQRGFLYLPFMHSESRIIHEQAEILYRANGLEENYASEKRHKDIIDRFGRYPHRNEILGRESSAAELEFLKLPGSRF